MWKEAKGSESKDLQPGKNWHVSEIYSWDASLCTIVIGTH